MGPYLNVAYDIAGYLTGVGFGLGLLGIIAWFQYQEFRQWPYSPRSFWLIKIGMPLVFGVMLLAVMGIASGIEGMEALGVFYGGVFVIIALAPIAAAASASLFGVSMKQALGVAGSLVAVFFGLAFGISMIVNAGAGLVRMDLGDRVAKYQRIEDEKNPSPVGDLATITSTSWWKLPDGNKLLVLKLQKSSELATEKIQLKTEVMEGRQDYRASRSFCFEGDVMTLSAIVDQSRYVDVRVMWRNDAGFLSLEHRVDVPAEVNAYLQVFEHRGIYDLPYTPPAGQVSFLRGDEEDRVLARLPVPPESLGRYEKNRCIPAASFYEPAFDALRLYMTNEETGHRETYDLLPRQVAPEFR